MAQGSADLPQGLIGPGASPKNIYVFFLLNLCKNYFETMRTDSDKAGSVDSATAALVAFCPDKKTREALWKTYTAEKEKSDGDTLTASVMTVGDLISYLSDTLEFTEKSTGGFL
jgi:hypothetical protein